MQLQCGHCRRVLEFSGERPSYCAHCGQALTDSKPPSTVIVDSRVMQVSLAPTGNGAVAVPETVGGYRLLRELGRGGMGTVFEAEETSSGRRVALKLLTPQAAASREALERFRQEGRVASQIAHPRCVFVLAADEEAGRPYIVMELMTGETLKDLVERQGPLPPEEAVVKILDVIEGLQEAHARGVVHRDVKPSNCFLLPDGRVKVGDFGLAKSLFTDSQITQSGTFLGTPLFASPEQIKGEAIGFQTDVYAVAATLYFLLTGQAPFQKRNAAAVLAGIVSEPPPPVRSLRPEVSAALDRVVLRGLERSPARRWRDLEEFRLALLPFVPGRPSFGGLGVRLAAFLIDCVLFMPLFYLANLLSGWFVERDMAGPLAAAGVRAVPWLLFTAYFVLLEGVGRASLGKRLLRLRVGTAGADPPGLRRGLVRALVFALLILLPFANLELDKGLAPANQPWLAYLAAGVVVLVAGMRAGNGYRGLHDRLSQTRVAELPPPEKREPLQSLHPDRQVYGLSRPDGMPATVGPYHVRGAVYWGRDGQTLLGEDPALGREVWLQLRPPGSPTADAARRELARPARLRWVTGGPHGAAHWDAYVAPSGCPLADLVNPDTTLAWREVRPMVQQLAEELAAACADGTLPAVLTVDQVWVQPAGRVQLLDFPLGPVATAPGGTAQQRALALLGRVAVLALEGRPRTAGAAPAPIRAPLPGHAVPILQRLLSGTHPYATVAELLADLEATRDRPAEVTPRQRAAHLGVLSFFLFPGLALMLLSSATNALQWLGLVNDVVKTFGDRAEPLLPQAVAPLWRGGAITIWPTLWVLWAFLARGGVSYSLTGIRVVRADGRKASRLRCAWRALLVWLPITLLLTLSDWVGGDGPYADAWRWGGWGAAITLLAAYVGLALVLPSRSVQDRLAGTYLVPK